MKVWVLEWHDNDNIDFECTVWATEQDALTQAVKEIKTEVDGWDLDNPDIELAYEQVYDFIRAGQHRKAIQRFNDYQDDHNSDYGHWYFVREKDVLSQNASTTLTLPPPPAPAAPYQATTAGATCRKCNDPNPYAYADKPDGTYCCRQCKTFSSIFGVTP